VLCGGGGGKTPDYCATANAVRPINTFHGITIYCKDNISFIY